MADSITTAQFGALVRSVGPQQALRQLLNAGITDVDGQPIDYSAVGAPAVTQPTVQATPLAAVSAGSAQGPELPAIEVPRPSQPAPQQAPQQQPGMSLAGGIGALAQAIGGKPAQPGAAPSGDMQSLLSMLQKPAVLTDEAGQPLAGKALLAALSKQYGDLDTAASKLRAMQYEQAANNLNVSRKWTPADWFRLSAALSAPHRTPGFAGFLQNVTPALAEISQSHYTDPQVLQRARTKLLGDYLSGEVSARSDVLKRQAELAKLELEADKPEKAQYGVDPKLGVSRNLATNEVAGFVNVYPGGRNWDQVKVGDTYWNVETQTFKTRMN